VIPALNEAENLPHVLPRIPEVVDEVILVDGNSVDDTVEVAKRLYPAVRIVQQEGRGKGAALRCGFRAATGDIVVMLDADGSTDPAEIPAFIGVLLAGADYAKGTRFLQGAGTIDMPLYRRLGNKAFVILTNMLFRTRFTDITYGYNATWRCYEAALALEIDNWACEIIGNIRAARSGLRIVEVASFEYERISGEAKLATISAGWMILKAILREPFNKIRKTTGATLYERAAAAIAETTDATRGSVAEKGDAGVIAVAEKGDTAVIAIAETGDQAVVALAETTNMLMDELAPEPAAELSR